MQKATSEMCQQDQELGELDKQEGTKMSVFCRAATQNKTLHTAELPECFQFQQIHYDVAYVSFRTSASEQS